MGFPDHQSPFDCHGTGEGTKKFSKDEECRGSFVNNVPHGYAEYTWEGNLSYKGNFYMGKKEGYGCQAYPDGRIFYGLFKDDKRYGPGVETYPTGHQDVGFWENNRLVRLCTKQTLIPPLPSLGQVKNRRRILESKQPRNRPLEILLEAGGQGLEEYVGYLCNPHVRQPKSLSVDHAYLRAIHRKGKPWGPDYKMVAWNNADHLCDMQVYTFNNRHAQDDTPFSVETVICNERNKFCRRGDHEEGCLGLLWSSREGDLDTARKYLLKRVDPDVTDGEGNTPLLLASAFWEPEVVSLLLDWSANINVKNDEGFSPLLIALYRYFYLHKKLDKLTGLFSSNISQRGPSSASTEDEPLIWGGEPEISHGCSKSNLSVPSGTVQSHLKIGSLGKPTSEKMSVAEPLTNSPPERDEARVRLLTLLSYSPYGWARMMNHRIYLPQKCSNPIRPPSPPPQAKEAHDAQEGHLPGLSSAFSIAQHSEPFDSRHDLPSWWVFETDDPLEMPIKSRPDLDNATSRALKTVEILLQRGANPNLLSGNVTPLTLAVRAGDLAMVDLLLKYGARPEQTLPEEVGSIAPIHLAANAAYSPDAPKIITSLMKAGGSVAQRVIPDDSYLSTLPERRPEIAQWMREENFQLQGKQALHIACSKEILPYEQTITKMRKERANADLTPIKSAIKTRKVKHHTQDNYSSLKLNTDRRGTVSSVRRSIASTTKIGIDERRSSSDDRRRSTAKNMPSEGKEKKVRFADTNQSPGELSNNINKSKGIRNDSVSVQVQRGREKNPIMQSNVRKLEERKIKMADISREKATLLNTVKTLVQGGSDVNEEVNGQNPLSLAIIHGNDNLLPVLLGAGADPNKQLSMGTGSALAAAVSTDSERLRTFQERKEIVETLVRDGKGDLTKAFHITPNDRINAAELFQDRIAQDVKAKRLHLLQYDRMDFLRKQRALMKNYLTENFRSALISKLIDIKNALMGHLHDKERRILMAEFQRLLGCAADVPTEVLDELKAIIFCLECGRKIRRTLEEVKCEICKMPFCSKVCKVSAIKRGHRKKECALVEGCRNIISYTAYLHLENPSPPSKIKKPILRRAVGYILTECRDMKVILTPSEATLHAVPGKENYSIN